MKFALLLSSTRRVCRAMDVGWDNCRRNRERCVIGAWEVTWVGNKWHDGGNDWREVGHQAHEQKTIKAYALSSFNSCDVFALRFFVKVRDEGNNFVGMSEWSCWLIYEALVPYLNFYRVSSHPFWHTSRSIRRYLQPFNSQFAV